MMRLYFVVTDNNASKKNADARAELKQRMTTGDLEADAPNRQFQFHKSDASGTRWFGGIDLDSRALNILAERRKSEPEARDKLAALLQAELRSLLPAGQRSNLTVQIVAADDDIQRASETARKWLEANWEYAQRG